jgi:hypothetical protein
MRKHLTAKQSLAQLTETKQISTGMLQALNMSFEAWLRYAQAPKHLQAKCVQLATERLTEKLAGKVLRVDY